MVVIREGIKYACNSCLSGHRTSKCGHSDRELIEIKKKGRPNSSCEICAGLRLKNSKHVRCGHLDKDGKEFNKKIQRNSKKSSDRKLHCTN